MNVQLSCGKPQSTSVQTFKPIKPTKIVRWEYHYKFRDSGILDQYSLEYKPLFVDFDMSGRVIQINEGGKMVKSTNYCSPNVSIKIGNGMNFVYRVCHYAIRRMELEIPLPQQKAIMQTTLTYQQDQFSPPTKFVFHGTRLVEISP